MFFRKKSKAAAPPAPVVAPIVMTGEPDIRGLGRVLWHKKTKILGITVIAVAGAFVVVNAITPRFTSESRLLLEVRENVFMRAEADKNNTDRATIDPEAVTSQIQVVLSRDLAHDIIKKENLGALPEFEGNSALSSLLGLVGIGRDLSSMSQEERLLQSYYERLNVYAIEKSRVIAIDGHDALEAVQAEEDHVVSERAAGEARARTARHERRVGCSECLHDSDRFVARAGKHRERRRAPVARQSVRFVGAEFAGSEEHTFHPNDFREPRRKLDHQGATTRIESRASEY